MTPLPKRRHSSQRQGKREKINMASLLPQLSVCPKCGHGKLPHISCPKCGFYK